jgi:hypothetical protein
MPHAEGDEMAYACPHCQRKVLSRRSGICGYCLNPLPSEILMTAAELEKVEAEERDRERRRKERAEAKLRELEKFRNSIGGDGGG